MEEGQLRRYGPGDTIRLQVGVQHRMRLEQVFATFTHEEKVGAFLLCVESPTLPRSSGRRDTASYGAKSS